jgi:ATP:ADP antiporter, AAA family
MESGRLLKAPRRIFNIKPGEGKLALLLFSYFFLITAPLTIIKTLRTTHFLWRMGPKALPVAYLLAAVATGLVVLLHSRIQFRSSILTVIVGSLALFAVSGLLLQVALRTNAGRDSIYLAYFYWVWASLLMIVLMTHFWMTINELFNPREARRLIGFLSTGGILGGILGGLLAGFLTGPNRAFWLMPLACVMLFGCILLVRAIFHGRENRASEAGRSPAGKDHQERQKTGFLASFHAVRKHSFLSLIAGITAIGVMVSTCIDFQFLSAARLHFTEEPRVQAFLGFFEPVVTLFVLFLNFFLAGYVLKKLNMGRTLLLTPAVLFFGSLAVLLTPFGLLPAIFLKGSDDSLTFSVNQSVREMLYIPVAAPLKHKAKPFIDMFISQFAKVAGALILLVFALLLKRPVSGLTPVFDAGLAKPLSWVVIALLVPWSFFGLKIGKEYLATLKENIKPPWNRPEKDMTDKLDVEYAKLVFDTIDSRHYSSVLYALHIFDLLAQDKLTPEMYRIISDKSGEALATALDGRLGAGGMARFSDVLDDFPPEDIRTEIPLIMSSDEYQKLMLAHLEQVLREGKESEVARMELAKAMGLMDPRSPLTGQLSRLIDDESPKVACFALKSAARLRKKDDIPAVIRRLGNFLTMEDAVSALHAYGDAVVRPLEKALSDRTREMAVRRAAAEALARIGTPGAVRALAEELGHGAGDMDDEVIDALDRLRSEEVEIPLSASASKRKIHGLIRQYCRTYVELHGLGPGEDHVALRHRLERNLEAYFANIFKLLGLHYPHNDIRRAYQNITAGGRDSIAHATEWLDNALNKDVKEAILLLVEDSDPSEKTRRFKRILKVKPGASPGRP